MSFSGVVVPMGGRAWKLLRMVTTMAWRHANEPVVACLV